MVFLTARDGTDDKIRGLTLGGDDYVTKPFSLEEVIARIKAVLRRTRGDGVEPTPRLKFADLELDEESHEVWRGGAQVQLSPTEFKLLRYFMSNANRVLSKMQILDHVWDYDFRGDTGIVESYVSVLRRKIDTKEPRLIHTLRGVGYVLRLPSSLMAAPCRGRTWRRRPTVAASSETRKRRWSPWGAGKRISDRTPLRTKLITAVLALVIMALAAIGVASVRHAPRVRDHPARPRPRVGRPALSTPLHRIPQHISRERRADPVQLLSSGFSDPGSQLTWGRYNTCPPRWATPTRCRRCRRPAVDWADRR